MGTGVGSGTYYQAASIKNISFYQLINNVINAALGSLIVPMLTDLLVGVFDIELTDEFPGGDPAKMTDPIFVMVLGLVETLATSNGADPPSYTPEDNATPLAKITAVLNWFILDGGMDTFILFDNTGLHITNAFMSLLGDLIRLLVNMFDDFGLEQVNGGYAAAELNENWYYNSSNALVRRGTGIETVGISYITFETENEVAGPAGAMVTYQSGNDGNYVLYLDGETYKYLGTDTAVDTTIFDVDLIRENRVVGVNELFAYAVSVLMNSLIPGCFFPEEAKSIAEVAAYGLAALTSKVLPGMNFLEQLDANYPSCCLASGSGSSTVYWNSAGQVVTPLAFVTHETVTFNGTDYEYYYPTAALKIASCIGAYYLRGVLEASFTADTNAETFIKELLVWGAERYLPILTGQRTGSGSTTSYSGGVFSAEFQSFARGTTSIYQLIDNTVFKLIPASWLPTKYASAPTSKGTTYTLVYEWLFGSLRNLDLRKLLGIFQVNTAPGAELNQPVLTVLLRLVDRILALVMKGNALLPPYTRNTISAVYATNTTVTSLDSLLLGSATSDPLPSLVKYLLQYFDTSAGITGSSDTIAKVLLGTVLPLLLNSDYSRPFRISTIGTTPTIKIDDLEIYVDEMNHFNDDAEVIEEGVGDEEDVIEYTTRNYVDECSTATLSSAGDYGITNARTDLVEGRNVYSGFVNATYTPATATTKRGSYTGGYLFFGAEDYASALHRYNNSNSLTKKGGEYVASYETFYKDTLSSNYGDWSRYFINRRLYAAGKYDSNGDGLVDTNDSAPGIPSSPYPYYNATSSVITYKDGVTNKTFDVNSLTAANYETISLALANAAKTETRVVLNTGDANAVTRLALGLAPSAFTGADFSTLTAAQIATLTTFLNGIGYAYDTTGEEPCITRPAFALITGSTTTGASVTSAPPTTKPTDDSVTDYDLSKAMFTGVVKYYKALDEQKQGLFEIYDEMNYRRELAESSVRNTTADCTQLKWALNKFEPQYYSGERNAAGGIDKFGRNVAKPVSVNGTPTYNKVYTASSYAAFQQAYDFATDLTQAARTQTGIPQSLVTEARASLITAYYNLVPFTGLADFTLLQEYVTNAQAIVASTQDPGYNAAEGFTDDSLANLTSILTGAAEVLTTAVNGTIDCESQDLVDVNAMNLLSAIDSLSYNVEADINAITSGYYVFKNATNPGAIKSGFVYNLTEGQGLNSLDKVSVVGLLIDEGKGNKVYINPTTYGRGTGSYIKGTRGNDEVFRYYGILFGDVNGDARIDGTDKTAIQFEMINNGILPKLALTTQEKLAADTNRDGVIDADDAVLVQARVDQPANMNVINQSSTVTG